LRVLSRWHSEILSTIPEGSSRIPSGTQPRGQGLQEASAMVRHLHSVSGATSAHLVSTRVSRVPTLLRGSSVCSNRHASFRGQCCSSAGASMLIAVLAQSRVSFSLPAARHPSFIRPSSLLTADGAQSRSRRTSLSPSTFRGCVTSLSPFSLHRSPHTATTACSSTAHRCDRVLSASPSWQCVVTTHRRLRVPPCTEPRHCPRL
jgi:hypothetical protein